MTFNIRMYKSRLDIHRRKMNNDNDRQNVWFVGNLLFHLGRYLFMIKYKEEMHF